MRIEEKAKELGIEQCYIVVLSFIVWGRVDAWQSWLDSAALLYASPEHKELAFKIALAYREVREAKKVMDAAMEMVNG